MSNTVLRTSLLTIDATGLDPFFRRGRRGSGKGEARAGSEGSRATGEKAGEGKLEATPALSYEQVLSQSLRAGSSGSTCGNSDKIPGARRRPPRGPGLPGPNFQWQQESPHRTRRRGALESGDRWVSRGLPGRRGRKERAPLTPPTPKTHRLTATPEELERNSPASTPHPKSLWPGRQSRSVRKENAPTPSTADPLGRPTPLASSEAHAPPGLDGPILGELTGEPAHRGTVKPKEQPEPTSQMSCLRLTAFKQYSLLRKTT